ncbi:MAG: hypothetical protein ACK506_02005 [Pirellula sp.]|jgi:hypothetical protein
MADFTMAIADLATVWMNLPGFFPKSGNFGYERDNQMLVYSAIRSSLHISIPLLDQPSND